MEKSECCAFAYMLECADGTLYSGYTTDMRRRLKAHNSGKGSKYTRARLPVKLAYMESFSDKVSAMKRECEFKKMTRAQKIELVEKFSSMQSGSAEN